MINLLLSLNMMFCDIKGEVKHPGVYETKDNNIVDIINKAGGLKKNANISLINLSKKVIDEMVIYIPNKNEKPLICPVCSCPLKNNICLDKIVKNDVITYTTPITTSIMTTKIIDYPTTKTTTKLAEYSVTTTKVTNFPININTASKEELLLINGIGEIIAERIVEYRSNTLFISLQDLLNIKGIGEVLFAKIKDYITI